MGGPRWDTLLAALRTALGRFESPLSSRERRYGWNGPRVAAAKSYITDVQRAIAQRPRSTIPPRWGGEGQLAAWGMAPSSPSKLAEDLVELENGWLDITDAAVTCVRIRLILARARRPMASHKDEAGVEDVCFALPALELLQSMVERLTGGEYLTETDSRDWTDTLVSIGGRFESPYHLMAPTRPVANDSYWRLRDRFLVTGEDITGDMSTEGPVWKELYLANGVVRERVERDAVMRFVKKMT